MSQSSKKTKNDIFGFWNRQNNKNGRTSSGLRGDDNQGHSGCRNHHFYGTDSADCGKYGLSKRHNQDGIQDKKISINNLFSFLKPRSNSVELRCLNSTQSLPTINYFPLSNSGAEKNNFHVDRNRAQGFNFFKMKIASKIFKKMDGKENEPVPGPSDLGKKDLLSKIKEKKKIRIRKSSKNMTFCPLFGTTIESSDEEKEIQNSSGGPRRNRLSSSFTEAVVASVSEVLSRPEIGTPTERAVLAVRSVERSLISAHSTVEYKNVLVPELVKITAASYYWGMMDRYEAESLLEDKPEGTFLLRDSAQINYLFSVSFRRYQRTLHARVEYLNGEFSFDIHDEKAFKSNSISKLVDHFKDPKICWYYEPQLSIPLQRNFVFSLKHLCRSVIVTNTTYEKVSSLPLPPMLKKYLREYHYKQPIRITEHDF